MNCCEYVPRTVVHTNTKTLEWQNQSIRFRQKISKFLSCWGFGGINKFSLVSLSVFKTVKNQSWTLATASHNENAASNFDHNKNAACDFNYNENRACNFNYNENAACNFDYIKMQLVISTTIKMQLAILTTIKMQLQFQLQWKLSL